MLIGLQTKIKLRTVSDNKTTNTTAPIKYVGVTRNVTHSFSHSYFSGPPYYE